MIVAFSTSSPVASVALFDPAGTLLGIASREAPMRASGTCLELLAALLEQRGMLLREATGFVADLGPGSFTGVKVGVTLAKTMAFLHACPCAGIESFDLINPSGAAAIPGKRTEYLVRNLGGTLGVVSAADLNTDVPGYGSAYLRPTYPNLTKLSSAMPNLIWLAPEILAPHYILEPSISTPKRPLEVRP